MLNNSHILAGLPDLLKVWQPFVLKKAVNRLTADHTDIIRSMNVKISL